MAKKKNTRNLSDVQRMEAILRRGGGAHDTRPRGERDRAGQKRAWKREHGVAA